MLRPDHRSTSTRVLVREPRRPALELTDAGYTLRLAATPEDVDALLELRFDVFNLELGEGLASSFATGRDEDEYDAVCDHLMVVERATGAVVGTYRLMSAETALATRGFYSSGEYDLRRMPHDVLADSVELGRACIAREHRNTRVLFLLWKGIAAYMAAAGKRYLFGCCSLTSQDAGEGSAVAAFLESEGFYHESLYVPSRAGYECDGPAPTAPDESAAVPRLFGTYLRFGAKVCSPPAIDRVFGTIDFLVLFDTREMDDRSRHMFFGA
jgi:putative hemolysin